MTIGFTPQNQGHSTQVLSAGSPDQPWKEQQKPSVYIYAYASIRMYLQVSMYEERERERERERESHRESTSEPWG